MKLMKKNSGALLLEVLVAATVLSIGILACLNIFSSAIHASNKAIYSEKAQAFLDQVLFESFLDPTSVDLESGSRSVLPEGKSEFEGRQESRSLSEEKKKEEEIPSGAGDNSKGETSSRPLAAPWASFKVPVEFFETMLTLERGRKEWQRFDEVVFRYGKKKEKQ